MDGWKTINTNEKDHVSQFSIAEFLPSDLNVRALKLNRKLTRRVTGLMTLKHLYLTNYKLQIQNQRKKLKYILEEKTIMPLL